MYSNLFTKHRHCSSHYLLKKFPRSCVDVRFNYVRNDAECIFIDALNYFIFIYRLYLHILRSRDHRFDFITVVTDVRLVRARRIKRRFLFNIGLGNRMMVFFTGPPYIRRGFKCARVEHRMYTSMLMREKRSPIYWRVITSVYLADV